MYDLYIAEGEVTHNSPVFSGDSIRKANLFNSVLKKHKTSRKQLDASLEWYADNLDKFQKINTNLSERIQNEIKLLEEMKPDEKKLTGFTELPFVSDSISFLNMYTLNKPAFSFRSDTTFMKYGGDFEVRFHILGVDEINKPEFTLCVECSDTTYVKKSIIENNGFFSESIRVKNSRFREVYGYIYFPEQTLRMNYFIYDFYILMQEEGSGSLLEKRPEDVVTVGVDQ